MATKLMDLVQQSNVSFDSFDFKIPISKVNIQNDNLLHCWQRVNIGTGAMGKKTGPSDVFEGIGYKIVFEIQNIRYRNFDTGSSNFEECLIIKFTSKCLEHQYLNGVDKSNLEQVYKWLIDTNFVRMSIDTFLTHSNITNLDFKIDFKQSIDEYFEMLSYYKSICKPSIKIGKGHIPYDSGTQFGDKKNTYLARPSFRVYHKEKHIIDCMTEFSDTFLSGQDVSNLVRCELNLKNATSLRHWGIEKNSFQDIASIPQEQRKKIMIKGINSHFDLSLEKKRNLAAKLAAKDLFIHYLISKCPSFDLDTDLQTFYHEYGLNTREKKDARKRLENRLNEILKLMKV